MSGVSLEPGLVGPSGFRFGEVSSLTAFRDRVSSVPSLGPLAAFTGTFRGSGFNTIFRPDLGSPTQLPVPVTGSDNEVPACEPGRPPLIISARTCGKSASRTSHGRARANDRS